MFCDPSNFSTVHCLEETGQDITTVVVVEAIKCEVYLVYLEVTPVKYHHYYCLLYLTLFPIGILKQDTGTKFKQIFLQTYNYLEYFYPNFSQKVKFNKHRWLGMS